MPSPRRAPVRCRRRGAPPTSPPIPAVGGFFWRCCTSRTQAGGCRVMHPRNRLWDLWEMLKAHAERFVRYARVFTEMDAYLEDAISKEIADKPVTDEFIYKMSRWLKELIDIDAQIQLPVTASHMERTYALIQENPEKQSEILYSIRQVRSTMEAELRTHKFLYVPAENERFYAAYFGGSVEAKFPDAVEDIESAGKCLALGLGTSSVFHLMRVMELAVQILSSKLGVSRVEKEWGKLNTRKNLAR